MSGARGDEDALVLRGGLVEQLETVTVGAKGSGLGSADNDLQRLGQQFLGQVEGVPGEGGASTDDIQLVGRTGLLAAHSGGVVHHFDHIDIRDAIAF
tara:strand:- start:47 stop:337 length:291 start_codon:yes stop_codon:yes gene_type:complete